MKELRPLLLTVLVLIVLLTFLTVWHLQKPTPTTTSTTLALMEKTYSLDEIQSLLNNQTAEACTQVKSPAQGHVKDICFFNLAFEKVNESYCSNIEDNQLKNYCVTTVNKRMEKLRSIGRMT